ncbi:GNAT family N-acetyltransferase [Palleronia sediminis]|uniref:GNAT family N-acetyltransferase n=1 Tax=Palleronia sediminis TaxID=2547833 RepID=A0A4R6AF56_9RHOB|nr:GNAT family N-acetyltransferase [Palleronia sediminis]TDL81927.1 GNAT family N-acetyltransferase [Palleronia sediminis]
MTDAELARLHAAAMTVPRPWSAAEIATLRMMPGAILAIRPDGFAIGRVVLDEAELLTVAVAPHARRRGLGRALLAIYHAEARARGAGRSLLEVADGNRAARALYEAEGYAACGLRRAYYTEATPPQDAIVMARDLAP